MSKTAGSKNLYYSTDERKMTHNQLSIHTTPTPTQRQPSTFLITSPKLPTISIFHYHQVKVWFHQAIFFLGLD